MKQKLKLIVSFGFILQISGCRTFSTKNSEANSAFINAGKSGVSDHILFLKQQYEKSQILFLVTSNHSSGYRYKILTDLLDAINDDSRLKMIVIERYGDMDDLYKKSSHSMESPSEARSLIESTCGSEEWASKDQELIQYIKSRNTRLRSKVDLRSIDGITTKIAKSDQARIWSYMSDDGSSFNPPNIENRGCSFENPVHTFMLTATRERLTAENFEARILNTLEPKSKAIVLYHYMHTMAKDSVSCNLDFEENDHWFFSKSPTSWTSIIFKKHPILRDNSSFVLIDEADEGAISAYNPDGVLKLSEKLQPYEDVFTVDSRIFKGISDYQGRDSFKDSSYLFRHNAGEHYINTPLGGIYDGVLFVKDAMKKSPLQQPSEIFPDICPKEEQGNLNLLDDQDRKQLFPNASNFTHWWGLNP